MTDRKPKVTKLTGRNNTTIVKIADGFQLQLMVYVGRKDEGEPDGVICTNRHTNRVNCVFGGVVSDYRTAVSGGFTKRQIINYFTKQIENRSFA